MGDYKGRKEIGLKDIEIYSAPIKDSISSSEYEEKKEQTNRERYVIMLNIDDNKINGI